MVILFQLNIVVGILIAYLSNFLLGNMGTESWRWMLGVEAIPALLYLILVFGVPRSPRWLLLHGNQESEAREVLGMMGVSNIDQEVNAIKASKAVKKEHAFFSSRFRKPILLAFLIAAFNQLSGINFIIYYAPRIFEEAGMGASTALLSTAGIGLANLIFTLLGMVLIDRSGRKRLMLIGSIGYLISLSLVARAFFIEDFASLSVPIYLFIFIAAHAVGQGAVIWVFISEIFPNEVRAYGQSLGAGTHWVFAALITLVMPAILNKFSGGPIFTFLPL